MSKLKMLKIKAVCEKTGLSASTIYERIKDSGFPSSVKVGAQGVAWVESEVDDWLNDRIRKSRAETK